MGRSERVNVAPGTPRSLTFAAPIWAIVVLCAQAQSPAPAPAPASLSGVVTNSVTGDGIARVHVTLRSGDQQRAFGARTDAEGKFSMAPLPSGQYIVEMERTGFLMRHGGESNQVEIAAGEKKDVTLKLVPAGSISGRVFDSGGEPMESITVQAEGGGSESRFARTDDNGRYRLSGLLPGKYRVLAAPERIPLPPEHRSDGTEEIHHTRTYYAGSLWAKGATRVTVRAGAETTGIDIHLVRTPIVGVKGTLVGFPQGEKGINFQLTSEDGNMDYNAVKKPDGTFELWRLDPGKYRLTAAAGGRMALRSAPVEFQVGDRNVEGLVLRAVAPSDIAGHVTYEDESAKPKKDARLILQEMTSGIGSPQRPETEIAEDGSFRLQQVQAGRYVVSVSWNGVYVKSMTLGTVLLDGRVLDLSAGSGEASLTVAVSSDVGAISGTVSDDKGPTPAFTVLVPEEDDGAELRVAMGPKGEYSFQGIAPGNYKIFALPQGESIRGRGANGRDMEMYEDLMESVTVGPGQKVVKDLRLREREE